MTVMREDEYNHYHSLADMHKNLLEWLDLRSLANALRFQATFNLAPE